MSVIDYFEQVTDKDGAVMARRLGKRRRHYFAVTAPAVALQGLMQLKDKLKKDDLVVCILHDHGSRYVAKIYNDQWMTERGFFDVKSFKDVVNARGKQKLITIEPTQSVAEAVELMKKYDIEHIPVVDVEGEVVGSISENGLFQKVFGNPEIKTEKVERVMEKTFPVVAFDTPVEKLRHIDQQRKWRGTGKR